MITSRSDDLRAQFLEYLQAVNVISVIVGDNDFADRLVADRTDLAEEPGRQRGRTQGIDDEVALTGDDQDNVIVGADGADTLSGGAGNDLIRGGTGADSLDGGDGMFVASLMRKS